jgi:hypothetical protein
MQKGAKKETHMGGTPSSAWQQSDRDNLPRTLQLCGIYLSLQQTADELGLQTLAHSKGVARANHLIQRETQGWHTAVSMAPMWCRGSTQHNAALWLTADELAALTSGQECWQLLIVGKGWTNPNTITNSSLHACLHVVNSSKSPSYSGWVTQVGNRSTPGAEPKPPH